MKRSFSSSQTHLLSRNFTPTSIHDDCRFGTASWMEIGVNYFYGWVCFERQIAYVSAHTKFVGGGVLPYNAIGG